MKIQDLFGVLALVVALVVALLVIGSLQAGSANLGGGGVPVTTTMWATLLLDSDIQYENHTASGSPNFTTIWVAVRSEANDIPSEQLLVGSDDGSANGGNFSLYRAGMFFDPTSYDDWTYDNISDYTVIAAELELAYVVSDSEAVGNIVVQGDIVTPNFYPCPAPVHDWDYNKTYYGATNFGQANASGLIQENITIPFSAQGLSFLEACFDDMTSKQSFTYICLMLRTSDEMAGSAPVGYEAYSFSGSNSEETDRPELRVQLSHTEYGASEDYTNAISTLFGNAWMGLTLASVGIIIGAAVGLLTLVMGAFRKTDT